MPVNDAILRHARDSRLAPLAFAAAPAWLWTDGGLAWANAAAAAALGAASPAALIARWQGQPTAAGREIARLTAGLPASGAAQLARLRGLVSGLARPLTCRASRLAPADGGAGVLVVAAEPVKPALSLAERVGRMLTDEPQAAAFGADGGLLHAGPQASVAAPSLQALDAGALLAEALAHGHACGPVADGMLALERLGGGDAVVLLATRPAALHAPEPTPSAPEAAAAQAAAPETDAPSEVPVADRPAEAPAAVPDRAEALALLAAAEERLVARRHPLRFVWTIDAEGRFMIEAGEFTALAGEPTASALGRPWDEAARALELDPEGRVSRAIASHDTWSGVTVAWPAEDSGERLPVLLSGLPVLNRDRSFCGYRGFGVCREVDRIAAVLAARRARLQAVPDAAVPAADEDIAVPEAQAPPEPVPPAPPIGEAPRSEPPVFEPSPLREPRTPLTVVPASKNVVPLRAGGPADRRPALSTVERSAFQEIARALGARLETEGEALPAGVDEAEAAPPAAGERPEAQRPAPEAAPRPAEERPLSAPLERAALDRLPVAVLLSRGGSVLFGNRALLDWTGYETLDALVAAGGLEALFADPGPIVRTDEDGDARALMLRSTGGSTLRVDARLTAIAENGASAMMLVLTPAASDAPLKEAARALQAAETTAGELKSILDTATDGVLVIDGEGRVKSMNRSAEALFGYDAAELADRPFLDLFAPESRRDAADYLEGLTRSGVASLLNDGREVIGRVRQGGLIPLFMTMGRLGEEPARFCAVFRDITQWKRAEEDLTTAKRQAEKASSAKSDFLAKISHEIRTPLNAIIGFSEVMMEERLGPIGNERYRSYARDIHTSGEHMISLLNDLLDLSKIEAGKLDLTFTRVDLNDVMQQCVAIMQPQANRERIIIRTALGPALPPVVADARAVRQIVLNLLSNSIKFTGAGGQVIVSTALTDEGEAVMRVRDTGIGMSEQDIETALEPFRQPPASAKLNAVGTGLGLPLTKALAEANRASFRIKSGVNAGTLVEISFPSTRVLSE